MADKREKMKRPLPVAELMASLFHGKPAEKRLEEGRIWLVWDAAVGEQIAAKARPVSYRDGVLTVAVASAPWMQQLTFLKREIAAKLNQRLGRELVRDIYLKAGVPQAPLPAKPRPRKERPIDEAEKLRIAEQSAAIADQELRTAVESLMTRHLSGTKKPD